MDFFQRLDTTINRMFAEHGVASVKSPHVRVGIEYQYPIKSELFTSRVVLPHKYKSHTNAKAAAAILSTFSLEEIQAVMKDESTYCGGMVNFEISLFDEDYNRLEY